MTACFSMFLIWKWFSQREFLSCLRHLALLLHLLWISKENASARHRQTLARQFTKSWILQLEAVITATAEALPQSAPKPSTSSNGPKWNQRPAGTKVGVACLPSLCNFKLFECVGSYTRSPRRVNFCMHYVWSKQSRKKALAWMCGLKIAWIGYIF